MARVHLTTRQAETLATFAENYGPRSSFPAWWEEIRTRILAALEPAPPTLKGEDE